MSDEPMPRAGVAACVVSLHLIRGEVKILGIRICKDEAEAKRRVAGSPSDHLIAANIWIEEDRQS